MVEKQGAAGHMTCAVRKQEVMDAGAHSAHLLLARSRTPALGTGHPHLKCVSPPHKHN